MAISGWDYEDAARLLFSTRKNHNGLWNSLGKYYVANRILGAIERTDKEALIKHFGVEIEDGETAVILGGWTRWVDYGIKSVRHYGKGFVLDKHGIVRVYKIKYRHEGGWSGPDNTKTTVEWTRPDGLDLIDWSVKADAEAAAKAEAKAAIPDLPTGKITVEGEIVSFKCVDTDWGTTIKMLVKNEEGWKVYGTVPKALNEAEVGDVVRFTANVEASRDDTKFGFYKRPTRATLVEAA